MGTGEIWALIIKRAIIIKNNKIGINQILFDLETNINSCLIDSIISLLLTTRLF